MFLLELTVEYNAAASLNIRMSNLASVEFFFHFCKTFSLIIYVIHCHTIAGVDFEVISVHANIQTSTQLVGHKITIQVLEIMLMQSFNHSLF